MNIKQAIYLLLNKIKSWEPKHVERPVSANQTSNWEWTAPYNGTLYLVVTTQERAYVTISYNGSAPIAIVAMPSTSPSAVTTIPITVKKGDIIKVKQLTTKCWLSTETSFIRGGGITLAISTLSALLERWWKHEYQTNAICDFAEIQSKKTIDKTCGNTIVRSLVCAKSSEEHRFIRSKSRRLHFLDVDKPKRSWSVGKFLYDDNKSITMSYMEYSHINSKCKGRGSRSIYQGRVCLTVRGCVA